MKEFEGGKEMAEKLGDMIEALALILAHWIMSTLFRRRAQQPARQRLLPVEPTPEPQVAPTEPRTVWNDKALRAKAEKASERLKAESDRRWQAVYLRRYLARKMEPTPPPPAKKYPHPKARKLSSAILAYANTLDAETAAEIAATPTDRLAREIPRIEAEGKEIAGKAIDPTITRPNAAPPIRPAWLDAQAAMEAAQAQASAQAIIDREFAGPPIDPAELEAVPEDFGGGMPPEISPDDLEPLPTSPKA